MFQHIAVGFEKPGFLFFNLGKVNARGNAHVTIHIFNENVHKIVSKNF
jgi:hypothetical protein